MTLAARRLAGKEYILAETWYIRFLRLFSTKNPTKWTGFRREDVDRLLSSITRKAYIAPCHDTPIRAIQEHDFEGLHVKALLGVGFSDTYLICAIMDRHSYKISNLGSSCPPSMAFHELELPPHGRLTPASLSSSIRFLHTKRLHSFQALFSP